MYITTRALTEANEATAGLLDQLGLDAYLFEVEPREGPWEVHVDCALGDGWQSLTLPVDMTRLLDTRSNEALRLQVLKDWRARLAACRYPTNAPE